MTLGEADKRDLMENNISKDFVFNRAECHKVTHVANLAQWDKAFVVVWNPNSAHINPWHPPFTN